jgi:hypothetical protein
MHHVHSFVVLMMCVCLFLSSFISFFLLFLFMVHQGGSGVPLNKEEYAKSVAFWRENISIK